MTAGLKDVDMVHDAAVPRSSGCTVVHSSTREYFHFFGLDYDKLKLAEPDALIMHPGPMNRGVEIGSEVADDIDRSLDSPAGRDRGGGPDGVPRNPTRGLGNNPPVR